MTKKTVVKKGNFVGLGSSLIDQIIKENEIDMTLYYIDSFKVKKGSWDTSAIKRDQELKWSVGKQTTTSDGKNTFTKTKDKQQFMEGFGRRFPEFMVNENKTNYIEVTFKRRPIEMDILQDFKKLVKKMPAFERPPIKRTRVIRNGVAAEITTFDAHLQKLAWERETGYRNYDLKIAIEDYNYTSDKNLDLIAPHKPEQIFYILGQDMYHVDNMAAHTTHGSHAMDVDGRITKGHQAAFAVSRDNIAKCALLAPVRVVWIPGNHDFLASYMLAHSLKVHFRNDKRIFVDIHEDPAKAILWGTLLVGWTHRIVGKHTVWSNELAQKFPKLWGESVFREWHHGDQHKKQNVKITPVFTSGGVVCRQITALSPVDKWHSENVFTDAVPGGESFLWSKEEGVFANFMSWTGQYEDNRNKLVNKK